MAPSTRPDGPSHGLHQALARRFAIDERALAAYRIAVGALLLVDLLAYRAPDLVAFYTDAGVLPRSLLDETYPIASSLSLHTLTGSPLGQGVLLGVFCLIALALLVGYCTRPSAIAAWIMLASMQARNPQVLNAGDTLLLATLFFGLFLPLGERWSLDALSRGQTISTDGSPASKAKDTLAAVASTGLILQILVVYGTNAIFKTRSRYWMDGTAVQRIFALDDFTVRLGDVLAEFTTLLVAANWVWFAALLASPLLVVLTGSARAGYIGLLAGLHLGMLATMMLGLFPLVSVAALLVLLPACVWDQIEPPLQRLLGRLLSRLPRWGEQHASRMPLLPLARRFPEAGAWMLNVALALLIVLGGLWHTMALGYIDKPEQIEASGGRAAEHQWRMFSPPSSSYGWTAAPVELASGEQVDALHGGPFSWEPPPDLADAYPSTLWHRFLKDAPQLSDPQLEVLAGYLCERVAEEGLEPPVRIEIVYVEHRIRLEKPDPVEHRALHEQACEEASS